MRLSPTRASDIDPDIAAGLAVILDGGPCEVGIESTVVDATDDKIRLLRPGGISAAQLAKIAELSIRTGASALGGFAITSPELPGHLDRELATAREYGLGLDLHVDENGNPASEILRMIAEAVLRAEFPYPVVCGHCCSLAVQDPARQRSTIDLVKAAGLKIISLPMCNLYLQDRRPSETWPRSPSWRGLTPIQDLLDAGVPVACASDNVRDAFFAYGDFDLLEVYTQSVRLAHLDSRLADSVRVVTSTAAEIVGRPEYGRIAPGAPAHLVITAARSFSELLAKCEHSADRRARSTGSRGRDAHRDQSIRWC
jgi:cytosine deaminase